MKTTRLAKLAALTQGAALLGTLGTVAAGCDKSVQNEPPQGPQVNATAVAPATASAPVAGNDDGGALGRRRFPILNAPPGAFQNDGNDAGK